MTTLPCSQTICQKSAMVCAMGPWVTMYAGFRGSWSVYTNMVLILDGKLGIGAHEEQSLLFDLLKTYS